MGRNRHVSRAVALSAAAALAVALSACSSTDEASKAGTFYGSELALGNGKVNSYVVTGDDGKPTELGFAFDAASLQGLPEPPHHAEAGPPLPSQPLYFPDEAKGVAVDHGTFDFVPGGDEVQAGETSGPARPLFPAQARRIATATRSEQRGLLCQP